jgi:hypothetical protein
MHGMTTDEHAPVLRFTAAKVIIQFIVTCIPISTVDTGMHQGRTLVSVWDCVSTHRDKSCPAHWTPITSFVKLSEETIVAKRMSTLQCRVVALEVIQATRTFDGRAYFVLSSVCQRVAALATFKVEFEQQYCLKGNVLVGFKDMFSQIAN